jgi:histidyl-tRNA synthetase
VFEAFERGGESRALAGGGRYDELVWKLTKTQIPACGFAIGDVTLGNLLTEKNLLPEQVRCCDFWIAFDGCSRTIALRCANGLRENGKKVLYVLQPQNSLTKQLKLANRFGARFALLFGFEVETGCVSKSQCILKDMLTGDGRAIPIDSLVDECAHLS